ncbi:MAG: PPOX class F420-dependent oxidoreductase [Anaerolineae bacterium]|nr:PPOX class F420-dependent oxidoreductase [Anaerolineae bacterium]
MATTTIPDDHRDLLDEPIIAVLTTLMPDGQPQMSLVWADYDGEFVRLSTALDRQKSRNMQRDPRVTLFVLDPANSSRWIEVRACVERITEDGAIALADKLAHDYTGQEHFYGGVYPAERQGQETRVVVYLRPTRVNVCAVH